MDATRERGHGSVDTLVDRWLAWIDHAFNGNRHLAFTLLAVGGIVLLGLIVVPVSIPEPLPGPTEAQVMGERYLRALPANAADRPTLDKVMATNGADGGDACTAELADTYQLLLAKRPGGGTTFSRAALADMRIVHRVYCPERTPAFNKYVKTRTAATIRARAAAQQAAGIPA